MVESKERLDEEIRQYDEHVGRLTSVTNKLDTVLRQAFGRHRAEFVQRHRENSLTMPGRFISERLPTETVAEWVKRDQGWPAADDRSPEARAKREHIEDAILWYEGVMFWLTTHPVYTGAAASWGSFKPDAAHSGMWKDAAGRDTWVAAGEQRKPFKVKLREDAADLANKYAEEVAERTMRVYIYKAMSKVLPILKRNRHYYAGLEKCWFGQSGIEADVRITMPDTRSFVFHTILKHNQSALGTPFYQYPLTYHDVYAGTGEVPVKFMSQQDVETMFGVLEEDRWAPTIVPEKKPRWRAAKTCDVVKFQGKRTVGLILGNAPKKKGKLRVLLANGSEAVVASGKIETVVTRISVEKDKKDLFTYTLFNQDWTVDGPTYLNKPQSSRLGKMFHGHASGNHRVEGAKMAFQVLCEKQRFPGSKPSATREAVPA